MVPPLRARQEARSPPLVLQGPVAQGIPCLAYPGDRQAPLCQKDLGAQIFREPPSQASPDYLVLPSNPYAREARGVPWGQVAQKIPSTQEDPEHQACPYPVHPWDPAAPTRQEVLQIRRCLLVVLICPAINGAIHTK